MNRADYRVVCMGLKKLHFKDNYASPKLHFLVACTRLWPALLVGVSVGWSACPLVSDTWLYCIILSCVWCFAVGRSFSAVCNTSPQALSQASPGKPLKNVTAIIAVWQTYTLVTGIINASNWISLQPQPVGKSKSNVLVEAQPRIPS